MSAPSVPAGRVVSFRFGLSGRRWGEDGPVVLLVHGRDDAPASLAGLVGEALDAGKQVIALNDPTDAAANESARVAELAAAIAEAAVELPALDTVVGYGVGRAAADLALARGLPVMRLAA